MPKIEYIPKKFRAERLIIIGQANEIIEEYQAQGYSITLRQLYYQFVARGLLPNTPKEYGHLGTIINGGRLAGYIDWEAIVDRTRKTVENQHWNSPREIIECIAKTYKIDTRATQSKRIEVWVEKEALAGVIERTCRGLDVMSFACKGYVSQSSMWEAAQRIRNDGRSTIILHLGDHDPSGIDMTRDIQDRLSLFEADVEVKRIALTMEQVQEYNPPPNPAKLTDTRCSSYIQQYGDKSWELDALEPAALHKLITKEVNSLTNKQELIKRQNQQEDEKEVLEEIAENL